MRTKALKILLITTLALLVVAVPASAKESAAPITFSGTLLDPLGGGAADQWVTLTSEDGALVFSVQSGAAGEYSFTEVPAGNYYIRVSNTQFARNIPPRYWISTHSPVPLTSSTQMDIPLPFLPLVVEVKEPDLTPLPEVDLYTSRPYNTDLLLASFPAHGKSQYIDTEPAVTDLDGITLLWLFPTQGDQTYEVTAEPSELSGYGAKIVRGVALTAPSTLTIVMDPPQNLSGTVSFPAGTPLANQTVSVMPQDPEAAAYPPAVTRPSGSFVFSIAPGNYNLRVEKNGASSDTPTHYWIETQNFPLSILMDQKTFLPVVMPFEEVTITVLDEFGSPVPNAAVVTDQPANNVLELAGYSAAGASQYTTAHPAYTNASGVAVLRLFPTVQTSSYTFQIIPPAGANLSSVSLPGISVPLTQPVVVTLPEGEPGGLPPANQAPLANAGPDQTVECVSGGTVINLNASGSTDPDGDPLTFEWSGGFLTSPVSGMQPAVTCPASGSYTLSLKVTDPDGASAADAVTITVTDSTAPSISASLSPVSGSAGQYTVEYSAADGCDPAPAVSAVLVLNGGAKQVQVTNGQRVMLEYSQSEPTAAVATVDGVEVLKVSASTVQLTVTAVDNAGNKSAFTTDALNLKPGNGGENNSANKFKAFVGGGGWFKSPAGAYLSDPVASGKLTIAFVVRFPKDGTAAEGHTVLHFHGTDLAIWAYEFESLSVSNNVAVYQGAGNDASNHSYTLRVTLVDGWNPPAEKGADTIRLQIWDQVSGELIYDNQMGAGASELPNTKLEGGSIVIN